MRGVRWVFAFSVIGGFVGVACGFFLCRFCGWGLSWDGMGSRALYDFCFDVMAMRRCGYLRFGIAGGVY